MIFEPQEEGERQALMLLNNIAAAISNLDSRIIDIERKIVPNHFYAGPVQIQIISTPGGIQDFINSAVQTAFNNLQTTAQIQTPEKPITVKELCDFLRVTEATIIRWRKKGKIPFMTLGSRVMFNKSAVIKALESKNYSYKQNEGKK